MLPSSRDVGRTKAWLLMSGRAWMAIVILGSAVGLASFAERPHPERRSIRQRRPQYVDHSQP